MPSIPGLGSPMSRELQGHVQSTRLFLRDFSELNLLIRGEESSDRMIVWSTFDFLSDFNSTPHFTAFTIEQLLQRGMSNLAVRGTVITLLQSLMIFNARNHLPFTDGGMSSSVFDRAPIIMSILNLLQSSYEQNKRMIKTALNIEGILYDGAPGGVSSDYLALSALGIY